MQQLRRRWAGHVPAHGSVRAIRHDRAGITHRRGRHLRNRSRALDQVFGSTGIPAGRADSPRQTRWSAMGLPSAVHPPAGACKRFVLRLSACPTSWRSNCPGLRSARPARVRRGPYDGIFRGAYGRWRATDRLTDELPREDQYRQKVDRRRSVPIKPDDPMVLGARWGTETRNARPERPGVFVRAVPGRWLNPRSGDGSRRAMSG